MTDKRPEVRGKPRLKNQPDGSVLVTLKASDDAVDKNARVILRVRVPIAPKKGSPRDRIQWDALLEALTSLRTLEKVALDAIDQINRTAEGANPKQLGFHSR